MYLDIRSLKRLYQSMSDLGEISPLQNCVATAVDIFIENMYNIINTFGKVIFCSSKKLAVRIDFLE